MALKCLVRTWMSRRVARIGRASGMLLRSNSSAVGVGIRALNAMLRWRVMTLSCGLCRNELQRPFCAERVGVRCRSRSIWIAIRLARHAERRSIRAVRSIIICTSNEFQFVEVVNNPVRLVFGDRCVPFADRQRRLHSGFPCRV